MHVITAERLLMKFCIRRFHERLLRQFRFYLDLIILTTPLCEILLTQYDLQFEENLYLYVCSQSQLRPEKKLSRYLSDNSHALGCTGST
jgi:hypothetical protein